MFILQTITKSRLLADVLLKDLINNEPKLTIKSLTIGKCIFTRLGNAKNAFRLYIDSYKVHKHLLYGALLEATTGNNSYFAT